MFLSGFNVLNKFRIEALIDTWIYETLGSEAMYFDRPENRLLFLNVKSGEDTFLPQQAKLLKEMSFAYADIISTE